MDTSTHGGVEQYNAKLMVTFCLTLVLFLIEVIGGFVSHSLALLSDAAHVLTDLLSTALTWYALKQTQKPANRGMTFGYHRASVIAAFGNTGTLILLSFWILGEAIVRLFQPEPIAFSTMIGAAGIGLLINLIIVFLLTRGEANLNIRSAILHFIGDAAASIGVITGAIVIHLTDWYPIDPILSVMIAFLLSWNARKILKEAIHILMEGVPKEIDPLDVIEELKTIEGIRDVHDLHIWGVSDEHVAMTCHLVIQPTMTIEKAQHTLDGATELLRSKFNIGHPTLQLETESHPHHEGLLHGENAADPPHAEID
ncbi:cation diffusion facilitator family transporter [Fodinisporobacter ferrooxydans]|uniref:Cation diffusion facilitator family transporter n=1 Tax=Fodinisporobacter ferrooxydans TaxID=2901836 RepID=A0ABY4CQK2_9BACL|nr:cation diffusion facilitator family transporter [Alicyclobacillaceae bacterium MYW30-H2]